MIIFGFKFAILHAGSIHLSKQMLNCEYLWKIENAPIFQNIYCPSVMNQEWRENTVPFLDAIYTGPWIKRVALASGLAQEFQIVLPA